MAEEKLFLNIQVGGSKQLNQAVKTAKELAETMASINDGSTRSLQSATTRAMAAPIKAIRFIWVGSDLSGVSVSAWYHKSGQTPI